MSPKVDRRHFHALGFDVFLRHHIHELFVDGVVKYFPQILSSFSYGCWAYSLQFNLKIQNFSTVSLKKFKYFSNFANRVKSCKFSAANDKRNL